MRVLVLFAHPVETSFASSLHAKVVEVLRAKGHKVDDCDLYAEGFDPVMSRQDRIDYHNLAVNRHNVAPYVDRLLAAEALVFSFPVWNMGFPAILKGFIDRVFLPGVSFTLSEDGSYNPCLHNIKRLAVVCTLAAAVADDDDGRSPTPLLDALHASDLRARRPLRLSRSLRHESFEARTPRGVPRKNREAVLELVNHPDAGPSDAIPPREFPLPRSRADVL